jgi:hypothetical protein
MFPKGNASLKKDFLSKVFFLVWMNGRKPSTPCMSSPPDGVKPSYLLAFSLCVYYVFVFCWPFVDSKSSNTQYHTLGPEAQQDFYEIFMRFLWEKHGMKSSSKTNIMVISQKQPFRCILFPQLLIVYNEQLLYGQISIKLETAGGYIHISSHLLYSYCSILTKSIDILSILW